jgi:hypothetical protein
MPISYALLLCIPIGFLFFFIARLTSRFVLGRYGPFEHRASMAWGVFGALLIPDLWILGSLHEEFSGLPGTVISSLVIPIEGLTLVVVFRLFRKSNIDSAPKQKVGS